MEKTCKGTILFLRKVETPDEVFLSRRAESVEVLSIGFSGRFDRYPQDNTMEGDIAPKCIVKLQDGHVHCFEIDYEVQLTIHR